MVWCPSCQTVLANEQVLNGACERCGATITRRDLEQWFLRITEYADRLLDFQGLEDWPEKILTMQTNWIGRSEGVEIGFDISEYGLETKELKTFTTRIDTVFGVTFVVLAPEHPLVDQLTTDDQRAAVADYIEQARRASEIERLSTETEKTGIPLGSYAVNWLNGERVPIYIGDYVLMSYGSGAVMGVPAHDSRDFAFANKYGLPVRIVIAPITWDGSESGRSLSGRRLHDQLGKVRRDDRRGGQAGHRRRHRKERMGPAHSFLPGAGLDNLPAALLGDAHTDGVLRPVRHRSRARGRSAGASAARRGVQTNQLGNHRWPPMPIS